MSITIVNIPILPQFTCLILDQVNTHREPPTQRRAKRNVNKLWIECLYDAWWFFDFYTNVRERKRERIERERSEIKKESKKSIRYIALPPGLRSSRTCQVQKLFSGRVKWISKFARVFRGIFGVVLLCKLKKFLFYRGERSDPLPWSPLDPCIKNIRVSWEKKTFSCYMVNTLYKIHIKWLLISPKVKKYYWPWPHPH